MDIGITAYKDSLRNKTQGSRKWRPIKKKSLIFFSIIKNPAERKMDTETINMSSIPVFFLRKINFVDFDRNLTRGVNLCH